MSVNLYLDESGYTGEDLLSIDQPVFVVASSVVDDARCRQILDGCFQGVQARELKHAQLGRRPKGQERVLRFIELAKAWPRTFSTFIVHKEFALVTKLVDDWVESAMYRDGHDLYDRGGNIALSNVSYLVLRACLPRKVLDGHLKRYQTMMRSRTRRSYDLFWEGMYRTWRNSAQPLRDVLEPFLAAERKLGHTLLARLPEHALDLAMSAAFVTVSHWRDILEKPMTVIHDKSSPMAREKWLWDVMVAPDVPKTESGHDRRRIRFPLGVDSTKLVDSCTCIPLQLVDILAGATAAYFSSRVRGANVSDYVRELEKAGIVKFAFSGLWPSKHVTPESLRTIGGNVNTEFVPGMVRKAIQTRDKRQVPQAGGNQVLQG